MMEASRAFAKPRVAGAAGDRPGVPRAGSADAAARYKSIYGKHDHTRGTVGMEAYAEAAVGHGATWWGAASGPSSARSAAISLRISATMARTASSSCDVRSVLRVALWSSDILRDVGEATGAAKVLRIECGARSGAGCVAAARRRRRGLS